MDIVESKYENFIKFLKENIKDSTYLTLLSTATCERFLKILKDQGQKKSPEQITNELCSKFGIDKNIYSPEIIQKFERYITYFQQVCNTIYK